MPSQPHSLPEGVETRVRGAVDMLHEIQAELEERGQDWMATKLSYVAGGLTNLCAFPPRADACRSKVVGEVRQTLEGIAGMVSAARSGGEFVADQKELVGRLKIIEEAARYRLASLDSYTETCDHEFVSPDNELVEANGWEVCFRCGKLKPPDSYTEQGDDLNASYGEIDAEMAFGSKQESLEFRVNTAIGIFGPYSQERAEQVHREALDACGPESRPPVIEFREVGPWRDNERGECASEFQVPASSYTEQPWVCGCPEERWTAEKRRGNRTCDACGEAIVPPKPYTEQPEQEELCERCKGVGRIAFGAADKVCPDCKGTGKNQPGQPEGKSDREELTMIALALNNQGIVDTEGVTPERGVELLIEQLYKQRPNEGESDAT